MIAGDLSPQELDLAARLAVAEGGKDPVSQAGVLSVVKNRLWSGDYGHQLSDVITAPHQFEAISNGSAAKIDPSDPRYQSAVNIAKAVLTGNAPDPTGGATHYYAPEAQAQLAKVDGRPLTPGFAKGQTPTAELGGNVYFAPNGPVNTGATPSPTAGATPPVPSSGALSNGGDALAASSATPAPSAIARPAPAPQQPQQQQGGGSGSAPNVAGMGAAGAFGAGLQGGLGNQQSLISGLLGKFSNGVLGPMFKGMGMNLGPAQAGVQTGQQTAQAATGGGIPAAPVAPVQASPLPPIQAGAGPAPFGNLSFDPNGASAPGQPSNPPLPPVRPTDLASSGGAPSGMSTLASLLGGGGFGGLFGGGGNGFG